MNTVASLFAIVIILLNVLWWVIIVQVILSWLFAFNVLNISSPFVRSFANALDRLTAPLYRPIRKIAARFRRDRFLAVGRPAADHGGAETARRRGDGHHHDGGMTARLIDGKAAAAELRARIAAEVDRLPRRDRPRAGPRGGAGRRRSGERGLCPHQGQGDPRGRDGELRASPARRPPRRPSCWRWSTGSTPTPRSTESSSSCRSRPRSTRRRSSPAIDPDKDVDGFHPVNAGRLRWSLWRARRLRAVHAAGLPAPAPGRAWRPERARPRW